ncbi:MAG: efflux RND transporter periplasmic adaptor subunit [Gloeobacterales cyanobacterium]
MRVKTPISQLFLIAFVLMFTVACGGGGPAALSGPGGPQAVPVKLSTVESSTIDETSEYLATLKSRKSVTLQPQVDGQVAKILVQAGAKVAAGTPLIQVNAAKQKATVSSLMAAAESNQADLESARATLVSYQADLRSKISDLKFQQQRYDRYAALRKEGAISQQDLDQYRNNLDTARASLYAQNAKIKAQQALITKSERSFQQSLANTKEQQVQLQYYRVAAPFAGTVGDIPVKVGDYVTTSTPLTTVTQNQPLEVNILVSADKASELRRGMSVKLLDPQGKPIGNSRVFFIAPNINNQTQSILIKSLFDNAADRLRADQLVQASVVWDRRPSILIPTAAISRVAGQDFVFVAQEQSSKLVARQKPIKLGNIQGNSYQVLEGLKPGEKIVVAGILKLSDGAEIVAASPKKTSPISSAP